MNCKPVAGWALYDLANTSFSALFITLFFPLFVTNYLGGNEFHVGLVFSTSFILAALFVPLIGAIADAWGRKMPLLILFTLLCVSATFFVGFAPLAIALILGVAAAFFFQASLDIYDALLVDISTQKNRGTISGIGIAAGYIGTILSLAMAYAIMQARGWESKEAVQLIFPATALFFLSFAAVSFLLMKEKRKASKLLPAAKKGLFEVASTIRNAFRRKNVMLFLLASFFYTDSLNIAIIFLYLYAKTQIGLSLQPFFFVFAGMAAASAIGALATGKLTDRIGAKKSLMAMLALWIIAVIVLLMSTSFPAFVFSGIVGAFVLGAVWTATRPMLIQIVPKHKVAEMLGFQGLTEKFSGGIGPAIFGGAVVAFGYQTALFVPLLLAVLAAITLLRVREEAS